MSIPSIPSLTSSARRPRSPSRPRHQAAARDSTLRGTVQCSPNATMFVTLRRGLVSAMESVEDVRRRWVYTAMRIARRYDKTMVVMRMFWRQYCAMVKQLRRSSIGTHCWLLAQTPPVPEVGCSVTPILPSAADHRDNTCGEVQYDYTVDEAQEKVGWKRDGNPPH